MRRPSSSTRRVSLALGIALLAAGGSAMPGYAAETQGVLATASGRHPITVEVADTPEQRETGLMFRKTMPADQGMLFDFDQSRPVTMWMKNTLIPLDMLFMDEKGVVTNVKTMAKPESLDLIPSGGPVRYVLELNGGAAARYDVRSGDKLSHPLIGRNEN